MGIILKIEIEIPPHLSWMLAVYQQKAEVRAKINGTGKLEDELLIALEQYAIEMIEND